MDLSIFNLIHSFAGSSKFFDSVGIFLAHYLPYLLVVALGVFIFRKPSWKERIFVSVIFALSALLSRGIITEGVRFFFHRARPFVALQFTPLLTDSSYSFPSGHATFFFALAAALYYFNKRWGIWFFVLSAIVGIARVFVGVHWPSDIVGGFFIGIVSFWIVHALLRKYFVEMGERENPAE